VIYCYIFSQITLMIFPLWILYL